MEEKVNRTSHNDFITKALKNPKVKKEYDRLAPVYEKIRQKMKQRLAGTEAKSKIP